MRSKYIWYDINKYWMLVYPVQYCTYNNNILILNTVNVYIRNLNHKVSRYIDYLATLRNKNQILQSKKDKEKYDWVLIIWSLWVILFLCILFNITLTRILLWRSLLSMFVFDTSANFLTFFWWSSDSLRQEMNATEQDYTENFKWI